MLDAKAIDLVEPMNLGYRDALQAYMLAGVALALVVVAVAIAIRKLRR